MYYILGFLSEDFEKVNIFEVGQLFFVFIMYLHYLTGTEFSHRNLHHTMVITILNWYETS